MQKIIFSLISVLLTVTAYSAEIAKSADEVRPLLVGADFPKVELANADGKTVKLKDHLKGQTTVLVFYRGGWCPYCTKHLSGLGEVSDDLKSLGAKIVAISPDKVSELQKSHSKYKLPYDLYSDSKMKAAKAFGVAFQLDPKLPKIYKSKYNIDLEASSGETHHQLPVPAVFVFNKKGLLTFQYVNPNYKVRLDGDLLLAAVKAAKAN
jgi:peroxiredoxin